MTVDNVHKTVLRNGLRIVSESMPDRDSVTLGIWIEVGSRHEDADVAGVSHFLEHMVFKATPTRTARQIASSIERLGGSLNAFTSREHTCYYARVSSRDMANAIDVLSDLSTRATLPAAEVKKERHVIAEEIKDSLDTPHEWVHEFFAEQMWPEHPIGRSIAGTIPSVMAMTRQNLSQHRARYYRPDRMVLSACGRLSHRTLVGLAREYFAIDGGGGAVAKTVPPDGLPLRRGVIERDIHQTHVCLGFPSWRFADARRHTILVLNNILGGGMSSRLFQSVREKRGLVYAIYPVQETFHDGGFYGVYFACDPSKVIEATNLVLKEFGTLAHTLVKDTELNDVKSQLRGNMLLGLESTSSRMHRLARHELYLGEYISPRRTMKTIENVSSENIRSVAREIFDPNNVALAILGPVNNTLLGKIDWDSLRPGSRRAKKRKTPR